MVAQTVRAYGKSVAPARQYEQMRRTGRGGIRTTVRDYGRAKIQTSPRLESASAVEPSRLLGLDALRSMVISQACA